MRAVHRLNVDATWDVTQRVAERWMIPRRSGFVAFLGFSPRRGVPMMIHSSTARSALETFAAGIAQEWSKYGIRAVCIAAGLIQTEGVLQYGGQEVVDEFAMHVPLRRAGLPEEVAATIAFLASPGGALRHRHDRRRGRRRRRVGDREAPARTRAVAPAAGYRGAWHRYYAVAPCTPRSWEGHLMADTLQNYIDGKFVDAADGTGFDVFNPATGEVIATAPDSKQADVDAAVSAARRTFDDGTWWPRTTERERGRILLRAADIVRREHERLAQLESLDSGKPIGEAREDIAEVAFMFEYYGGWATKIYGDIPPVGPDAMSLVVKEPVGVAAAITPWNYPMMMAVQKVAPAIAAGMHR